MDEFLRSQSELVIILGVLALLAAAVILTSLAGDERPAARPRALPAPNVWEDFRYPVLLRRGPGGFGPQLPGVKPSGRFFSLWGLCLSCTRDYVSRFTGARQRIRQ